MYIKRFIQVRTLIRELCVRKQQHTHSVYTLQYNTTDTERTETYVDAVKQVVETIPRNV